MCTKNTLRAHCVSKKCYRKDAGLDAVSPWESSSQGSHSVVPIHNPKLAPRDAVRQTGAAESSGVSASRTATWHAVSCGLQSRLEKSAAFQNRNRHLAQCGSVILYLRFLSWNIPPYFCATFVQRQDGRFCHAFSALLLCHDGSVLEAQVPLRNGAPGTTKSFGSHWENFPALICSKGFATKISMGSCAGASLLCKITAKITTQPTSVRKRKKFSNFKELDQAWKLQ